MEMLLAKATTKSPEIQIEFDFGRPLPSQAEEIPWLDFPWLDSRYDRYPFAWLVSASCRGFNFAEGPDRISIDDSLGGWEGLEHDER